MPEPRSAVGRVSRAASVASLATSNLLLVVSLGGAKAWLLSRQVSAFPLAVLELTVGAGIVLVTAAVHGRAPFDFLSEVSAFLICNDQSQLERRDPRWPWRPCCNYCSTRRCSSRSAAYRSFGAHNLLSPSHYSLRGRVLAFTQFSSLWLNSVLSPSSVRYLSFCCSVGLTDAPRYDEHSPRCLPLPSPLSLTLLSTRGHQQTSSLRMSRCCCTPSHPLD